MDRPFQPWAFETVDKMQARYVTLKELHQYKDLPVLNDSEKALPV